MTAQTKKHASRGGGHCCGHLFKQSSIVDNIKGRKELDPHGSYEPGH